MFNYSFDGETFYGDNLETVEEAIIASRIEYQYIDGAKSVFIGEDKPFEPWVDGESVCDALTDQAIDEIGECAEEYLDDVTKEQYAILSARLTGMFEAWAKEFGHEPNFWCVKNVKEYFYKDFEENK